jgi:undecaprenyl-diphosphatase
MALAFSIFFLHKKAGYYFMFFALLIGLARIMAGVHFPADILGGFVLGFAISFIFDVFFKNRKLIP